MNDAQQKVVGVLERAANMAQRHGTAYIKIRYDRQNDDLLFNLILPEFVEVSYEKK